ncbi:MAG TPA: class I SAM-dependent methyltransferase [Candidatus Paceibacterota bacterium]|nr:class I SAM-dependent methyltransferase [Candidatus Paceibacterota bacterium]
MHLEEKDLTAAPWDDYELIDSGANRRLERYGKHTVIRPETQALWHPLKPDAWKRAAAEFRFEGGKGSWRGKGVPEAWQIVWRDVRFTVRLTSFKHVGVFPEQAANWEWIGDRVGALAKAAPAGERPQVLNLFGYTGIASIAAARAGAFVTHVDASKQSNAWAKDNAALSGIPEGGIRYILDDALRFVLREARRGARYDGIILDPPAFGRGAKGEVWRIEEHLPALIDALQKISRQERGSFLLVNGYAAGYSPRSLMQAVEGWDCGTFRPHGEFGELGIGESSGDRVVPSGIYVRFALG